MGKQFAPAYANIFMAKWEEKALQPSPKKTTLILWSDTIVSDQKRTIHLCYQLSWTSQILPPIS